MEWVDCNAARPVFQETKQPRCYLWLTGPAAAAYSFIGPVPLCEGETRVRQVETSIPASAWLSWRRSGQRGRTPPADANGPFCPARRLRGDARTDAGGLAELQRG